MEDSKDTLGDRLKAVEQTEAGRKAMPGIPLMARLDGRAFHTFTRGLQRPFDRRMSQLMIDTTRYLIEKTHAHLGYCQSDEISLFWYNEPKIMETNEAIIRETEEYLFGGKYQKLCSVLAGMASAVFTKNLALGAIPGKEGEIAVFDCRVWNVDDMNEVYLNYLWRQDDCIKNSISMAAQAQFSHKQLHGVGSEQKKEMLREIGRPWEVEPAFFKTGTFVQRVTRVVELTPEQKARIPAEFIPEGPVMRTFVEDINLGYLKDDPRSKEIFS